MGAPRLSSETKRKILEAYLDGEKIATIAAQFGVHQSYPRILARRHSEPSGRAFLEPKRELETQ